MPEQDAAAIFAALQKGQLFSRQICGNVRHPLSLATRDAYTLMIRIAARNLDAELQSPDFSTDHPPIRTRLRGAAQAIAVCRRHIPQTGPGWRELQIRLQRAAAGSARA